MTMFTIGDKRTRALYFEAIQMMERDVRAPMMTAVCRTPNPTGVVVFEPEALRYVKYDE